MITQRKIGSGTRAGIGVLALTMLAALSLAAPASAERIAFDGQRGEPSPPAANIYLLSPLGNPPTRLTNTGFFSDPSFSGDGQTIVFTNDDDIFSMPASGGTPVNLTDDDSVHRIGPDVSPLDGRIVFQHFTDGLVVMGPDGSAPTPLGQFGAFPNWGSNDRIVFQSGGEIATINPNGTGMEVLTNDGPGGDFTNFPAFSNDAEWIVYVKALAAGGDELWIMRSDGSQQQSLGIEGFAPKFGPNDDQVVFENFPGRNLQLADLSFNGAPRANAAAVTASNVRDLTSDAGGLSTDQSPDWWGEPSPSQQECEAQAGEAKKKVVKKFKKKAKKLTKKAKKAKRAGNKSKAMKLKKKAKKLKRKGKKKGAKAFDEALEECLG